MFVVDTSVLMYAVDRDSRFHERCRTRLERWQAQADPWFLTWGIVDEFLRVTTHSRALRRPWTIEQAWGFVAALLQSPGLSVLVPGERHVQVTDLVFREVPHLSGNLIHDARIAILMREHGIRRIYTRDTHFHRFPFLEPVDPLEVEVSEPRARRSGSGDRRGAARPSGGHVRAHR